MSSLSGIFIFIHIILHEILGAFSYADRQTDLKTEIPMWPLQEWTQRKSERSTSGVKLEVWVAVFLSHSDMTSAHRHGWLYAYISGLCFPLNLVVSHSLQGHQMGLYTPGWHHSLMVLTLWQVTLNSSVKLWRPIHYTTPSTNKEPPCETKAILHVELAVLLMLQFLQTEPERRHFTIITNMW